uniref:Rhodanese domain-containing protein n=1 Tax=Hippocampus comes TaxID=109280 RepID=A0A3Q2Y603_HIPCM
MNPYTKEVLEYKNAEGKIIIVYDEDERIASQAATSMCQRGFENLFLLSGGLKVIAQKFPEGMTTGPLPASCLPPTVLSKWKKGVPPPPPQPFMQVAVQRWRFTPDELARIEGQLENFVMMGILDPLIVRPVDGSTAGLVCNPGQNERVSMDLKSNIARVLTAQSLLLSGHIEWNCTGPMRKRTHRWY